MGLPTWEASCRTDYVNTGLASAWNFDAMLVNMVYGFCHGVIAARIHKK